jgi:GntR family transcriptional regulator, transcriptional repressor for pyruvate dehydrogenase complex
MRGCGVISCLTSVSASSQRRRSPLRTIKRTQRSGEVQRQIETAIRNGDFATGERLPSERELVETFGVSRVSIREAIRSLETLGLVRVYQGRGAFVNDRRSGLGEPLARWLDVHRDEVLELFDVRSALDGFAAELAVRNYDDDKIDAIARAEQAFAEAAHDGASAADLVSLDIDFHLAIADAAGNRLLHDLLSDVHLYLTEARHLVLSSGERSAQSAEEHARIRSAIAARDAAAAVAATHDHFASVRDHVAADMRDGDRGERRG